MRRVLTFAPLIFSLALLAPCVSATPPSSELIVNPQGREVTSLDGTWHFIVDPYESGLRGRYYEDRKPKDKAELVEYNFDASPTLKVPGDWNSQKERLLLYEGPVWYRRLFTKTKAPGKRTFLYFGAANYRARVFLNGQKIGEHEGGFTPFNFEVSDFLKDGENSLVVEVDDTRRFSQVPSVNSDWWNYGGLTREVELVDVPKTFIRNYVVQLAKGSENEISGWVQADGAGATGPVTIEIPEAGIHQTGSLGPDGRADFHFPAKLELWSPEHPKLYRVIVSTASDRVEDKIGFRSIETRGTQILLNGKPIFLRGICMHEEAPFRGGRSFSEADDRTLLDWVKDLHANFVRLAHYPHNETLIRMADRMGILVWEEVPVYWDIDWTNPATLESAESQMRDVIARDHNRASVILWSLSNETPAKAERTDFLESLAAYTRAQDSTRLITSALNTARRLDSGTMLLDDPVGESLDVLGMNEYLGWYGGAPGDADHTQWKIAYQKPLIVSEFGGGAPAGNHGDADARWTEEYQASIFTHQINMLQRIPELAGMTPWVLMDFRSPRRPLANVQDYYNRKGLISDRGQRKLAFGVLQKFYIEKEAQANY